MKRLAVIYSVTLALLTVAAVLLLRLVWPEHYPSGLFLIPLYFALMLGVMIMMHKSNAKKGRDRSYFLMSYRIVKIMVALIFILVYFRVVSSGLPAFAVIFIAAAHFILEKKLNWQALILIPLFFCDKVEPCLVCRLNSIESSLRSIPAVYIQILPAPQRIGKGLFLLLFANRLY